MVRGGATLYSTDQGETSTSNRLGLDFVPGLVIPLIKANYLFVSPWIVLSVPPAAILQQQVTLIALIVALGLVGMFQGSRRLALLASMSLLLLLVWGRAAGDLLGLGGPDTAMFLIQFVSVLFFMEAAMIALTFERIRRKLGSKQDELSGTARTRVARWARVQLLGLGKMTLASIGLSLGLLVLGSVLSVSINQLAFTAILVLVSVVAILFLLTNRREPQIPQKSGE